MTKIIELESIILAAGRQTRYGGSESKLMAMVDGKPAFYFLMSSVLQLIPEELVTIISSTLFQDFNDFINRRYQKVNLIFDQHPGSGSARTLKESLPWETDEVFITEANIFYESSLIRQLFTLLKSDTKTEAVLAVTPHIEIASTHRPVVFEEGLDLTGKNIIGKKVFKNMGAYAVRSPFQESLNQTKDIIEVLNLMILCGRNVKAFPYLGNYLHIETPRDMLSWEKAFMGNDILVANS